MQLLRILVTGMLISFLGTLPLGTLNIASMQISVSDGFRPALYFAIGVLLVEAFYVRISLVAIAWVSRRKKLFRRLEWVAILIIMALAVSSFIAASSPASPKNVLLSNTIHRFWLGVVLSAVNPVQIPFWFGWSAVLFSKNILQRKNSHFNAYIAGIALGTLAGHLVFILGGRLLVDRLNANQQMLQWIIGSVFAATAIIMCRKVWKQKDGFEKLEDPDQTNAGSDPDREKG